MKILPLLSMTPGYMKQLMDATALLDFFAPLRKWLREQNAGQRCGWN